MPTIPLSARLHGAGIPVYDPSGGVLDIPRLQFRCLLEVPGFLLPRDAIIDTGAPLVVFPGSIWTRFQPGTDFDFLPFVNPNPPPARVAGWQFAYQFARFRTPLALLDAQLRVRVPRPDVVAQFATGDPPGWRSTPPVIVGLWGGVLEGARIGIGRAPGTNRTTGELIFP